MYDRKTLSFLAFIQDWSVLSYYILVGLSLFLCCRIRSILGVMYVAIKVGLILVVEAGIFPLMCGWWIDICAFVSRSQYI